MVCVALKCSSVSCASWGDGWWRFQLPPQWGQQLGPLPQQLLRAELFDVVVSELWTISPFKYILDFTVQLLLFLFPYLCIQIMNCSATSLRKRITGFPINSRWLRQTGCLSRAAVGKGSCRLCKDSGRSTEWGWPQISLLYFWIIYFKEEAFLHWGVGFLFDWIDCLLWLKAEGRKTLCVVTEQVRGFQIIWAGEHIFLEECILTYFITSA